MYISINIWEMIKLRPSLSLDIVGCMGNSIVLFGLCQQYSPQKNPSLHLKPERISIPAQCHNPCVPFMIVCFHIIWDILAMKKCYCPKKSTHTRYLGTTYYSQTGKCRCLEARNFINLLVSNQNLWWLCWPFSGPDPKPMVVSRKTLINFSRL